MFVSFEFRIVSFRFVSSASVFLFFRFWAIIQIEALFNARTKQSDFQLLFLSFVLFPPIRLCNVMLFCAFNQCLLDEIYFFLSIDIWAVSRVQIFSYVVALFRYHNANLSHFSVEFTPLSDSRNRYFFPTSHQIPREASVLALALARNRFSKFSRWLNLMTKNNSAFKSVLYTKRKSLQLISSRFFF